MAEHWVDTAAGGLNTGHTKIDAWTDITSWITHAKVLTDFCNVRGNGQIHPMAADKNWSGDGAFGNPLITRGDPAVIWVGDSGVRPIMDFAANNVEWIFNGDEYHRLEYIEFRDGEGRTVEIAQSEGTELDNCIWTDNSGETPGNCIRNSGNGTYITNCTFGSNVDQAIFAFPSGALTLRGCTIDNAITGLNIDGGCVFLENVVFGGSIANTTDIQCTWGQVVGRNVTFNAVTEVDMNAATPSRQEFVAIEDYNGVKGAWKKWYYHGTMESFSGPLTPGGQRAGGSYWVIKTVANGNGSIYAPLLCRYWPVYVALGGSGSTLNQDVTVWIQPDNGDASVPDTQGADADVWVEVAAWNNVTGEYDYYDSRDKAVQNVQVDHAWGDIVVDGVDIGATGWIIIRMYCISTDTFYIDRVETIA